MMSVKTRDPSSPSAQSSFYGSATPSSNDRPRSKRRKRPTSSPLSSKVLSKSNINLNPDLTFISSPIKKAVLPSPSPDRAQTSKSSPLKKDRKTVMFTEKLVQSKLKPQTPTPRKPILKNVDINSSSPPPSMGRLTNGTPTRKRDLTPDMMEFWSPGNIPQLSAAGSSDDLTNFKRLLHGGLKVLSTKGCTRQFEVYATFNLHFKDLSDKKVAALTPHMPLLLTLMRNEVIGMELTLSEDTSNPFLTRIYVQIIKIFNAMLSSAKLQQVFWKKDLTTKAFVHWVVSHACTILTRPDVPKSLLSASLQMLKDQKAHALLSPAVQEQLLDAVMRMRYVQSASILGEKLNTLRALVVHCSPMMEKNVKVWMPFLFNCLCDYASPMYIKTVNSATLVLLEAAKVFVSSKQVNFEVRQAMISPIYKTLDVAPQSQLSIGSSPLDLSQQTQLYLLDRLKDLLYQGNAKTATDVWLGLTMVMYNDPTFLRDILEDPSPWSSFIVDGIHVKDTETKLLCLKAWKSMVYVIGNALDLVDEENFERLLSLLLKVFGYSEALPLDQFSGPLSNLTSQILYALFNNTRIAGKMEFIIESYIVPLFENFLKAKVQTLTDYTSRVFNHLLSSQSANQDYTFYLVKVMTPTFDYRDIKPLSSQQVLKSFSTLFPFFATHLWCNHNISSKIQASTLSYFLSRLKGVLNSQPSEPDLQTIADIIDITLVNFIPAYLAPTAHLDTDISKIEHVNRLIILLKTTVGATCIARPDEAKQMVYVPGNIYFHIVNTIHHLGFRVPEVLKFLQAHIKGYKLHFFEELVTRLNDPTINQFITHNLETFLFERQFTENDITAFARTIPKIPKTELLLKSFFEIVNKLPSSQAIAVLQIPSWSCEDLKLLLRVNSKLQSRVQTQVVSVISQKLQMKDAETAKMLLRFMLAEMPKDALCKFKEHLFFHAIDYQGNYSCLDHMEFFEIFRSCMTEMAQISVEFREAFFVHGINLSLSIIQMATAEETLLRVCRLVRVMLDYLYIFRSKLNMELLMPSVSATVKRFEDRRPELEKKLSYQCRVELGWTPRLLDSEMADTLAIKDTLTIVTSSSSLKNTVEIGSSDPKSNDLSIETAQLQVLSSDKSMSDHLSGALESTQTVRQGSIADTAADSQDSGAGSTQVIEDVPDNAVADADVDVDAPLVEVTGVSGSSSHEDSGMAETQVIENVEELDPTPKIQKSTSVELSEKVPGSRNNSSQVRKSETVEIDSSPLKYALKEGGAAGGDNSANDSNSSDCELLEIDPDEFRRSFSQKRSISSEEHTPKKRHHTESSVESSPTSPTTYSSPTPRSRQLPTAGYTLVPAKMPAQTAQSALFRQISGFLEGFTDDQIATMTDGERYEAETMLLQLMMRMRRPPREK